LHNAIIAAASQTPSTNNRLALRLFMPQIKQLDFLAQGKITGTFHDVRIRESVAERRFPNRPNVSTGGKVSTKPPTRSKPVWKPALRLSTKDSHMRAGMSAGGHATRAKPQPSRALKQVGFLVLRQWADWKFARLDSYAACWAISSC
jgi:hypothetical protein